MIPYNIASYATLALILEEVTGHKALAIQGDLKKVHLYDNSLEAAKLQQNRFKESSLAKTSLDLSEFKYSLEGYNPLKYDYDVFTTNLLNTFKSFKLVNYEPLPTIKVEMLERS